MIEQLRARLRALLDERAAKQAVVDTITAGAEARGEDLTADEAVEFRAAFDAVKAIDAERSDLEARVAELEEAEARKAQAAAAAQRFGIDERTAAPVHVARDEPVYRPDGERSFFSDLFHSQILNDRAAADRIERNQRLQLETRDTTTSTYNGAIPPMFLVDMFAPLARAGRPFLNSLTSMQLPEDGMSFTIPRGTTGATAANTAENSGWSEQDQAVTDLTFRAELITSQQDISRATFMRGGAVVDQIVFPDMVGAYQTALNANCLNGDGTSPNHRGIRNVSGISAVAYTDASPTVGEILPKIQDAIQRINTLRFAPATAIYMHPRRWAWFKAAVDTTGRPVLPDLGNVPQNAIGVGNAAAYGQVVGTLGDLPVITDASIPTNLGAGTNEDIIIIARTFDIHLWEDNGGAPFTFTFEQTQGPQTVRLAVGGFSAFTAGRYPTAIATVGGTGLVAPAF